MIKVNAAEMIKKLVIILFLINTSMMSYGQDKMIVGNKKEASIDTVDVSDAVEDTNDEVLTTVENLKHWGVLGSYSYADTWLPGKIGLTASYGDENRVYEFAYQNASYSFDFLIDDLGKISDTRIHLSTRSHTWNGTFNFQYGLYYNSLNIHLGNTYIDLVNLGVDVLSIQTIGGFWGVGNRWKFKNGVMLGFDWFKVFWPFYVLDKDIGALSDASASSEKDDLETLVDGISKLPTFSLAHFEIGYRF